MRYPSQKIERIKALRRRGFTLGEIVRDTRLPKSTVFHHIKNIIKSKQLTARIVQARYFQLARTSRRGKSFKSYPHLEPTEWSPIFVNLVAHILFDGQIARCSVIYNNRSEALINLFISEMDECIGVSDYKFLKKPDDVLRVSYHHVEITTFLKQKAVELLSYVSDASTDEKLAFLKAFFDDEGNVSFTSTHRLVRGYQHSVPILELIQKLLADFGIASRIQPKFFEICISRKADILRFADLINFSEGVCVNGMRSNSVWKESLEKREILRRLIKSYRLSA